MNALRLLAPLAAVLLLTACAEKAAPAPGGPALNSGDPAACAASGGTIKRVCRLGRPMCVKPYPDHGLACTDDKQCAGGCIYDGAPVAADGATTGLCRADNDPCGCVEHVVGGKKVGGICVD